MTPSVDSKYEYVCYLDADLVVIDMRLDLRALVAKYSWADLIVSRDTETKNGIMNSGNAPMSIYGYKLALK